MSGSRGGFSEHHAMSAPVTESSAASGSQRCAILKGSWDLATRAINKGNYTYNCL